MLSFKLIRLWERWAIEHQVQIKRRYNKDNALTFFQFNYSIRSILQLLYRRNLQSVLYGTFYAYMRPPQEADFIERYKSCFYSYGLFGILDEWIKRDFVEPPEQMARLTEKHESIRAEDR